MDACVGFATGQLIQCVLVGGFAHNIEVVGTRTGKIVASDGAFAQEVYSEANNKKPDHKAFPHEKRVTVREGGGKAMVFWGVGRAWLKKCEVAHGYEGWGLRRVRDV